VNRLALIVHGGAWDVPPELYDRCREGVRRAAVRGWHILQNSGSALDACEQSIIELEEEPVFDAGIGSHLNSSGKAQLDAILMDGASLATGAVACVERIRNPIRLARLVMQRSEHVLLSGYGAEQFAGEQGCELCDPSIFLIPEVVEPWSRRAAETRRFGTVGAVALDANGHIAAGTSTGGTFFKHPGRIGDSPIVGCGCYADDEGAGVSCTGHGESVMKIVMAKKANDLVASGYSAQDAAERSVELLGRRTGGRAGLIVLDRAGRVGASFSTKNLVRACITTDNPNVLVDL
jgi:beta-aspartyl-peptidase (threonine type)